ncbi:NIPSNAP family protein [Labrys sp. KB_33_2]|uniref:NIPSNAP family protein n=1 Tax=unclassified Labrys (in: a-proteobacteria) TaxID=2688601 RepID=UPI003EBB912F
MITCHLKYVIDPWKVDAFEAYAKAWIPVVNRMGGTHHGYFLPHEGASDIAYALFSFPSLAAYEDYRRRLAVDPECQAILAEEKQIRSILRYERNFLRPVLG